MLFWHKCIGLINVFVKNGATMEVTVTSSRPKTWVPTFMSLRPGSWVGVLTLDLSIDKQAIAAAKATGVLCFRNQGVGGKKTKETVSTVLKEKVKEKAKAPLKSKRKTTEPPVEGAPKKKLFALAMQISKGMNVRFPLFFSLVLLNSEPC